MSYTTYNNTFTYTIANNSTYIFDQTDYSIIKSAFDRWDDIITIDSRFGESYSIHVDMVIDVLEPGTLGGASIQTITYMDTQTFGNTLPYSADLTINASYVYGMKTSIRSSGKSSYYYVLLHEIGHILGIGSFWHLPGTPKMSYLDNGVTKYLYTGVNALREYNSYFKTNDYTFTGIPIEDDGGGGTELVHPEEGDEGSVSFNDRYVNGVLYPGLNTELMTGWLDNTTEPAPLSRITLGFLQDMGYGVKYNLADVYIEMAWLARTDANNLEQTYIQGFLDVSGNVIHRNGTIDATNGLNVSNGALTVTKDTTTNRLFVDTTSKLTGKVTILNDVSMTGSRVDIIGNLYANYPDGSIPSSAIIGGIVTTTYDSNATFNQDLTVVGSTSVSRLHASGDTSLNRLFVTGGINAITSPINTTAGLTVTNSNITVTTGNVTVTTGNIISNQHIKATEDLTAKRLYVVNGNASIDNGNFNITNGNINITNGNITTNNYVKPNYITTAYDTTTSRLFVSSTSQFTGKTVLLNDVSMTGTRVDICGNFYAKYPDSTIPPSAIIGGVSTNNFGSNVTFLQDISVSGLTSTNTLNVGIGGITSKSHLTIVNNGISTSNGEITMLNGNLVMTNGNIAISNGNITTNNYMKPNYLLTTYDTTTNRLFVNSTSQFTGKTVLLNDVSMNGTRIDICGNFYAKYPNDTIPATAIIGGVGSSDFTTDISINGLSVGKGTGNILTNTVFGMMPFTNGVSGNHNTAFGYNPLRKVTTGSDNTAIGFQPLSETLTGTYNTGVGSYAANKNTSGSNHTVIGSFGLYNNTIGTANTGAGSYTLYDNTTGSNNVALGYYAGSTNTDGSYNTFLGFQAKPNSTSYSYSTAIGANSLITASRQIMLGTSMETVVVPGKMSIITQW